VADGSGVTETEVSGTLPLFPMLLTTPTLGGFAGAAGRRARSGPFRGTARNGVTFYSFRHITRTTDRHH